MMIGIQVLYSGVLIIIGLTLHGRHAFTTAVVRLKQKFSFSNFCPGRGLKPGSSSLMALNLTTRLRRHPAEMRSLRSVRWLTIMCVLCSCRNNYLRAQMLSPVILFYLSVFCYP